MTRKIKLPVLDTRKHGEVSVSLNLVNRTITQVFKNYMPRFIEHTVCEYVLLQKANYSAIQAYLESMDFEVVRLTEIESRIKYCKFGEDGFYAEQLNSVLSDVYRHIDTLIKECAK